MPFPTAVGCFASVSSPGEATAEMRGRGIGEVAKRSNAADCKSVAPGLRRFESSPRHQPSLTCWRTRASARQASSEDQGRQAEDRQGVAAGSRLTEKV